MIAALLDPVGGSAARDAARRELERSEYHREPGIAQRVLDWVGDRLASLFNGSTGSNATLLLLVFAFVALVVLAVRAGRPSLRRRRGDAGTGDAVDADLLTGADSRQHRRAAARYEAENRLAEALREWLRAAVATIEERGVLPPRPGRTGAATAREAGPALPAAAGGLATAMTAFEQVWFGGRAATPADVTGARAAADTVASARITAAGPVGADLARW